MQGLQFFPAVVLYTPKHVECPLPMQWLETKGMRKCALLPGILWI